MVVEKEARGRWHANVTAWPAAVDSHARKNESSIGEGYNYFCRGSNRAPTRSGHIRNMASDLVYGKERIRTYLFLYTNLSLHLSVHDRRPTFFLSARALLESLCHVRTICTLPEAQRRGGGRLFSGLGRLPRSRALELVIHPCPIRRVPLELVTALALLAAPAPRLPTWRLLQIPRARQPDCGYLPVTHPVNKHGEVAGPHWAVGSSAYFIITLLHAVLVVEIRRVHGIRVDTGKINPTRPVCHLGVSHAQNDPGSEFNLACSR